MVIKRDVKVEWYMDGALTKTETYRNRTVYVAKDGSEKINWTDTKRSLDADGVCRIKAKTIDIRRPPFPWM